MHHQAHITLVNEVETSAIEIADRGLAYGDGLFETMRVVERRIPLLKWHLERFRRGVEALALGRAKKLETLFKDSVNKALKSISGDALIKVIVTRGKGGRGYQVPEFPEPTIVVQVFNLPVFDLDYYSSGVAVKLCHHTLPIHPALAGIKHLNRLDQVIASQEIEDEQEGLLCDPDGNVIEGIKSNLVVVEEGQVLTPRLDRCGVEGSLKRYIMDHQKAMGLDIREEEISKDRLMQSQGVMLINSVFGCWPVSKIDDLDFSLDPTCEKIHQFLKRKLSYS